MSDLTGRVIGQYQITGYLGKGGMATVYRAVQTSMGREVAIKFLPREFLHDDTFLQRFLREAQVISRLEHVHILPVYDYGELEGVPYIVMRLVTGGSLDERIRQASGGMPLDEVARLAAQMASALDYAHGKGIIHRDFKPNNVLLDSEGSAYLADFGIAKVSEATVSLTSGGIIGTPGYMAPEMAQPGGVTPAVDIYALAVTVYEMLTGKLPFNAETPMGILMAHVTQPIPDIRTSRPDLPDSVQAVLGMSLAKDPARRYRTAGDFVRDLQAAAAGRAVMAAAAAPRPPAHQTDPATMAYVTGSDAGWTSPDRTMPAPENGFYEAPSGTASRPATAPVPAPPQFRPASEVQKKRGVSPVLIGCGALAALAIMVGGIIGVLYLTGSLGGGSADLPEVTMPYGGDTGGSSGGETGGGSGSGGLVDADADGTPDSYQMPTAAPTLPPESGCPIPPDWVPYIVQSGDTLAGIALAYGMPVDLLMSTNCLSASDIISPGMTLYVVVPTETPASAEPYPGEVRANPVDGAAVVYIPSGSFTMGLSSSQVSALRSLCGASCPSWIEDYFSVSQPSYTASTGSYWIYQFEVSNRLYQQCVSAGACQQPDSFASATRSGYYGSPTYSDYPVVYVSWYDALEYCGWANGSLPTEAEWERAARGSDGRLFPWGDAAPSSGRANTPAGASEGSGDTAAVGSYSSGVSPYGVYDMAGNVWEWVGEWHPAFSGQVIGRGGSWRWGGPYASAAYRDSWTPDSSDSAVGFRCVVYSAP